MIKVGLKLSVARNERQLAAGKIQSQFRTRKVATSQKAVLESQTQLQQVTVRSAKLEQALGCAAVKAEKDRSASKIQQSYRKRQQVSNEQGVREWHTEVTVSSQAVCRCASDVWACLDRLLVIPRSRRGGRRAVRRVPCRGFRRTGASLSFAVQLAEQVRNWPKLA